mmetsp:Transcript_15772/g.32360  ORF Transcript_15772/g.32360 Transcript_15772/m.32360 type:complete len:505 (+) Transcript_15772:111-1625(+)
MTFFNFRAVVLLYAARATAVASAAAADANVDADIISTDVLILGAGGAGLAVADELERMGISDYIILEGFSDYGGRMRNHDFNGYIVQDGANWIQGTEDAPMMELARSAGMQGTFQDWDSVVIQTASDVEPAPEDDDVTWGPSIDAFNCVYNLGERIDANGGTWAGGDDSENSLDIRQALRYCGWLDESAEPINMAIEWFEFDYEFATVPGETSLTATTPLAMYLDFGDSDWFVNDTRGWKPLLDNLSWNPEALRLNTKVESIESTDDAVFVKCEGDNGQQVYKAKYAVSTFSLGVLQEKHREMFSPPLPSWKSAEVMKFDLATYVKIFITFESNFWPPEEQFLFASRTRGFFPHFQNLDLSGFFPGSNMLLATMTGDWAKRAERMTDDQVLVEAMAVLEDSFGKAAVSKPTGIYVSRWFTDPLFYGAYSNWPTGVSDQDFNELRTAVGRVLFSGEATSARYNGYVLGALEAGRNSAREVAACIEAQNGKACTCVYNRQCDTTAM